MSYKIQNFKLSTTAIQKEQKNNMSQQKKNNISTIRKWLTVENRYIQQKLKRNIKFASHLNEVQVVMTKK